MSWRRRFGEWGCGLPGSTVNPAPGVRIHGDFSFSGGVLFENLSVQLHPGVWNCLLGLSGIGKSTLLRLMAGLDTGGEFTGTIAASDGGQVASRTAYMAQSDLLFPWLNVQQNVQLGSRLRGDAPDAGRVESLLERVGLAQHKFKRPGELSGGMRQRAALARTLMEEQPVILLDEPFSALDSKTRAQMQELAFALLQDKTVLLVTHDPVEAIRLGQHLYSLSGKGIREHALPNLAAIRSVAHPALHTVHTEILAALA